VDAGGEFVITQIFFDNDYFYDFVERAQRIGISVPIIPGILPILNLAQVKRFTGLSGATIPPNLARDLERLGEDDAAVRKLGIDYATQQSLGLLEQGVPGIHFYCLNRSASVKAIFKNLGPPGSPARASRAGIHFSPLVQASKKPRQRRGYPSLASLLTPYPPTRRVSPPWPPAPPSRPSVCGGLR
jgi:hypothetical protein